MPTRLVAVQDTAYKSLASTTGRVMTITEEPKSLTEIASLALSAFSRWLDEALQNAEKDPRYRDAVKKAFENKDDRELAGLLLKAVGDFK